MANALKLAENAVEQGHFNVSLARWSILKLLTHRHNGEKVKHMDNVFYLLSCFGERYINVDNDQATLDASNREVMVGTYNAILDVVRGLLSIKE